MKQDNIKALLVIAHGSKNSDSNTEIHDLTALLETLMQHADDKNLAEKFTFVDCAFLELTDPDIATVIERLVKKGAIEITVLPYFLAKGNHINRDIPEKIAAARMRFPDITITVVPHIGKAANMPDLLIRHLQDYMQDYMR